MPDVAIVGAGLIGLGIAWRCAQAGLDVAIADPAPGSGASHAAGGMLAPVTEVHYGEQALLRLNLESNSMFPAFAAELEELTGMPSGYEQSGTLVVGFDSDDMAVLDDLLAFQRSLGLEVERLGGRDCRRLEPMLAPAVRGGLLVASDHRADPRQLVRALLAALDHHHVAIQREPASLVIENDRAIGVRLDSGTTIRADTIVLAAGAWSGTFPGLPPEATPPVRPVKGQILRLQAAPSDPPLLRRVLRAVVRGSHLYLVPRASGELVVGATAEEQGFDVSVTAGAVYELLRDARTTVPGITELPLAETTAGLRPGSPDNAPLIGPSGIPGLLLATGHYRNGVLLTPVTAHAVAALIRTGELPAAVAPFTPQRFARGPTRPTEGVAT